MTRAGEDGHVGESASPQEARVAEARLRASSRSSSRRASSRVSKCLSRTYTPESEESAEVTRVRMAASKRAFDREGRAVRSRSAPGLSQARFHVPSCGGR